METARIRIALESLHIVCGSVVKPFKRENGEDYRICIKRGFVFPEMVSSIQSYVLWCETTDNMKTSLQAARSNKEADQWKQNRSVQISMEVSEMCSEGMGYIIGISHTLQLERGSDNWRADTSAIIEQLLFRTAVQSTERQHEYVRIIVLVRWNVQMVCNRQAQLSRCKFVKPLQQSERVFEVNLLLALVLGIILPTVKCAKAFTTSVKSWGGGKVASRETASGLTSMRWPNLLCHVCATSPSFCP